MGAIAAVSSSQQQLAAVSSSQQQSAAVSSSLQQLAAVSLHLAPPVRRGGGVLNIRGAPNRRLNVGQFGKN